MKKGGLPLRALCKGLVYSSWRQYTLGKVCKLTVAEGGMWSGKMAPGDISGKLQIVSRKFQSNRKFQNNAICDVKQISNNGMINHCYWYPSFRRKWSYEITAGGYVSIIFVKLHTKLGFPYFNRPPFKGGWRI